MIKKANKNVPRMEKKYVSLKEFPVPDYFVKNRAYHERRGLKMNQQTLKVMVELQKEKFHAKKELKG